MRPGEARLIRVRQEAAQAGGGLLLEGGLGEVRMNSLWD